MVAYIFHAPQGATVERVIGGVLLSVLISKAGPAEEAPAMMTAATRIAARAVVPYGAPGASPAALAAHRHRAAEDEAATQQQRCVLCLWETRAPPVPKVQSRKKRERVAAAAAATAAVR